MELIELIRGAQDAMDNGDYRLALAECRHVLDTYPSCVTAHRMLGEASLEQGQIDAAIEHFEQTLERDPLNVVARLGLGVAAEERKETTRAYAEYLHAWEINPALDQVRDELVRLRGLLGGDERLHPTRAGLAGIFERSGQFGRAAAEWRSVLLAEPESERARTALAGVLWRSGDDAAAAAVAREVLAASPENARALAILGDIEQRRGAPAAVELIDRYQFVDPIGEIATVLADWREDVDLAFLRRASAGLPEFAFVAEPEAESAYPAAAVPGLNGTGTGALSNGHFAAPDLWDTLVRDLASDGADGGELAADVMPFSWQEEGEGDAAPLAADAFSLDAVTEQRAAPPADIDVAFPEVQPMAAARGDGRETQLAALGAAAAASPAVGLPARSGGATSPPPAAAASPFVTADGQVDLTVGWDDLDRQLREATPSFDDAGEIDALAAELGVGGIAPFEIGDAGFDAGAWAPFTDDDLGGAESAPAATADAPTAASDDGVSAAAEPAGRGEAWTLDDDLLSAIPAAQSSGYTDLLRHIDKDLPPQLDLDDEVDPFANPDAAGAPLAFEDLLAVTSKDGTAPLASPASLEQPAAADELDGAAALAALPVEPFDGWVDEPAAPEPVADAGFDALLDGLGEVQPFSLDDAVAEPGAADAVDFSDINEPPFDPGALPTFAVPDSVPFWADLPAAPVEEAVEPPAEAGVDVVAAEEPADAGLATRRHGTEGLGLSPSEVAWPTFVNQASELIDRGYDQGSLFARLRDAKRTAVSAGLLAVDRSLMARVAAAAVSRVEHAPEGSPERQAPAQVSTMTEAERIDLMAMRVRLIEDEGAAAEVAGKLEAAVSRGLHDPLALRVLGEAYMKLGRMEQAAAQFRNAMLARRRGR